MFFLDSRDNELLDCANADLAERPKFFIVLGGLVEAERSGLWFPDGVLLSNVEADLSGKPDACFVSKTALETGQVRVIEGAKGGSVELEGSADMVLEVVSRSSVGKDTDVLRKAYWEAGVREYWLVDARKGPLKFDILRHTERGYVAARKQDGWVKSAVFGKSFRLTQGLNALRHPEYTLAVRCRSSSARAGRYDGGP